MDQVIQNKPEGRNSASRELNSIDTKEEGSKVARRRFLALALGGAAVTATVLAGRTQEARADIATEPDVFHLTPPGTADVVNTFGRGVLSLNEPLNDALRVQNLDPQFPGVAETLRASIRGITNVLSGSAIAGTCVSPETDLSGAKTSGIGVNGKSNSPLGAGIKGENSAHTDEAIGVFGLSSKSASGIGVLGVAVENHGSPRGVRGETQSPSGIGVEGVAKKPQAVGVRGEAPILVGGSGAGVEGFGTVGVRGFGTIGVHGRSNANVGIGVEGFANPDVGPAIGVRGKSGSSGGIGVHGFANSGGGSKGVVGEVNFFDSVAVEAKNNGGGVGLRVQGQSQFSTIVDGTITAGSTNATVPDSRVSATSAIMITLTDDPGPLNSASNGVSWVSTAAGSFTVNLLGPAAKDVPFRAFVVEKA